MDKVIEENDKVIEEIIPKDIPKQIAACFDSYDLCEDLSSQSSLKEEEQETLDRNIKHIQLMYSKDWFKDALSNEESEKLKKYI